MSNLETAIRRASAGEIPVREMMQAFATATLVVPSESPAEVVPVTVHRDGLSFVVVFTRTGIPFAPAAGRTLLSLPASILVRGLAPGVGIVVNPGSELGFELAAESVAGIAAILGSVPRSARHFVRFRHENGAAIPFALLRRRFEAGGHVDEVLRDVDQWAADRNGSVERALRFPLDTDLVEVDAARAEQFMAMVAACDYRPFV